MIPFNNIFYPWLCSAPINSKIWQGDYLVYDENGCARIAKSWEEYKEYGIGIAIETSIEGQERVRFIQETTKINIQYNTIATEEKAVIRM